MKRSLRPAVFLDRDGTLIRDRNYLKDPRHLHFYKGVFTALRQLREAGYRLVMVTNQSGIGRGFFRQADLEKVHLRFRHILRGQKIRLDGIFVCPHHPDQNCNCRKPQPALFLKAARQLAIDLKKSYFVGDKPSDVLPALRLKGKGILVLTGLGQKQSSLLKSWESLRVARSLPTAVKWILKGDRHVGD